MSTKVYEKHHLLELPDGPVSVYESGSEAHPPVLLLHGAMSDEARFTWYHLAPFLAKTRHVFSLDFPRHGHSRPWKGVVDQDALLRVIDEVISRFSLPPMPFIGLSMGGGVTIAYALVHPERVTGAVLMAPGGLGDKLRAHFLTWAVIKIPGLVKSMTWYYAKLPPVKLRRTMVGLLHDGEKSAGFEDLLTILAEEVAGKWTYHENAMDDWQLGSIGPLKLKLDFLPELHRLQCPVLYLRGENDPLVGQTVMEQAARLTPNAALRIVKNAGHLLPLERPDEVKQAVAAFLSEKGL